MFKNKLCLEHIPDATPGWPLGQSPFRCKRHVGHHGKHRVKFTDAYRTWNDGDEESKVEPLQGPE